MVTLNSIFRSDMIMQANKPVRFFGNGRGQVKITFNGTEKEAISNGKWLIEFEPVSYGGPYDIDIFLDGCYTLIKNVYFGDVYLLGGQSNMQFKLKESSECAANYKGNENVYLYTVDRMEKGEQFYSVDGWVKLTKDNARDFSAIGYYVGQGLATSDRKIGLIACYQGASVIQSWMSKDVALAPEFYVKDRFIDHEWFPIWNDDGVLYEHMIEKILPFSLNSVLWYQGESNASNNEADIYLNLLEALIKSWRRDFKDENLRFIVIQLADHLDRQGYAWETIQKAQLLASEKIPLTDCVICRDVCDNIDIHPREKDVLSNRIVKLLK